MDEKGKENNALPLVEDTREGLEENKPLQKRKRGRPPGAKNKDTLFKELMTGKFQDIAEQNIQKTLEKLFEEAHEGNMQAIKLVMDRVVPVTKAVDLADMEKKGLTISINVGSLEAAVSTDVNEPLEAEFEEVSEEVSEDE